MDQARSSRAGSSVSVAALPPIFTTARLKTDIDFRIALSRTVASIPPASALSWIDKPSTKKAVAATSSALPASQLKFGSPCSSRRRNASGPDDLAASLTA